MTAANLKKWAEQLRNDAIDATPRDYQWDGKGYDHEGTGTGEDGGPGWRSWEPCACEKCGAVLVLGPGEGNESHHDARPYGNEGDEDEGQQDGPCDGNIPAAEGPMMSYYYPVEIRDHESAARALAGLPVCVVEVDGETGIALTGGGMDLSWEICEAYTRLGYLPPVHFAGRLPRMADRMTEGKRRVLAAAKRAAEIRVSWAERAVKDIEEVGKWMRQQERKRAAKK